MRFIWCLISTLYSVSISNNDRILSDYNRGCFFLHQLFLHFKFYNIPFIGNYISNGLFYPIWAIGPTWLTQLPYHLSSVLLAVSNSFQFISLKRWGIAVRFLCVKILDNYFWRESWWQSLYLGFLDLTLTPFPMLLDNYAYILKDSKSAVVVDPGDPEPVIVSFLQMSNSIISCIYM